MKRIFFIVPVFLIVPVICFAQNKKSLSHFWDIPWGISMEQAESIFEERGFGSARDGDSLIAHAKYEGEEAEIILLFNKTDHFYSGNVVYPSSENTAINKYKDYRILLFRRYGMPDTVVEYYNSPYQKGDGREIEAISTENAFFFSGWQFNDNCQASVSILKNLDICLSFSNPVYKDEQAAKP